MTDVIISSNAEWQEPQSIKDAEAKKDKILSKLFNLDAQLNSKNLTNEAGQRLDSVSYQDRKHNLTKQKAQALRELKRLRNWIKSARFSSAENSTLTDSALLRKAYSLFLQLKDDGVDFDKSELEFLDVLAARIGE